MPQTIARAVVLLLRLLLPARGRHRSAGYSMYGIAAEPRWIPGVEVAG
ncbi:hypothetical protein ACIPXV_05900 [Streptomyces libani]|nr:hypothetical protein [Streptomyces sp. ID38640]QIK06919.1 hypothetical protein G7Z12_13565 [Streptomyces sp. ID38640]